MRRLGAFVAIAAVLVLVAVLVMPRWASTATLGTDGGNAFGWNRLPVGAHVILGYDFWNHSSRTIVLRSASVPPRVHLRVDAMVLMDGYCSFFGATTSQVHRLMQDVTGYRLAGGEHICVAALVTGMARGKYLVGPVTLHAEIPLPLKGVPIEATSGFRTVLCVKQAGC